VSVTENINRSLLRHDTTAQQLLPHSTTTALEMVVDTTPSPAPSLQKQVAETVATMAAKKPTVRPPPSAYKRAFQIASATENINREACFRHDNCNSNHNHTYNQETENVVDTIANASNFRSLQKQVAETVATMAAAKSKTYCQTTIHHLQTSI
jgi:hypothetical protein